MKRLYTEGEADDIIKDESIAGKKYKLHGQIITVLWLEKVKVGDNYFQIWAITDSPFKHELRFVQSHLIENS